MKKLFALAVFGWLCGGALAQSNPAPAAPAQTTPSPTTPAANSPAAPAAGGNIGERNAAYTDRIPPEQMITLDANGDKFQARHIADLSGLPRGAVIILHDSGQHPSWPFTTAALIDELPLHGWDTLNIELPVPATDISSPADAAVTPAAQSTPATTPAVANSPAAGAVTTAPSATPPAPAAAAPGSEPRTQARISAAIKYFSEQNQRNIVLIGFGSGAIRAAESLRLLAAAKPAAAANTAPITALVMIAPQQKLTGVEMDLPKLLPLTQVPALDLALDSDPMARAEAEARRRAVLQQRTRIYTRVELAPINNTSDAQHSAMVKRVRSWLQVNAQAAR